MALAAMTPGIRSMRGAVAAVNSPPKRIRMRTGEAAMRTAAAPTLTRTVLREIRGVISWARSRSIRVRRGRSTMATAEDIHQTLSPKPTATV